MNRTTLSLIAAGGALAVITGVAAVAAPGEAADDGKATAAQQPVERAGLLCPAPSTSELAETEYTSFTPKSEKSAKGSAELFEAPRGADAGKDKGGKDDKDGGKSDGKDEQAGAAGRGSVFLRPKTPGTPMTGEASGAEAPALIGEADGALAPGWTVQQTTTITAGSGRGVAGVACSTPDTDFWFPGVSAAKDRSDYVHLTNPDDAAAVVDIELFGPDGDVKSSVGEDIQVPPHSSVPVLVSTLTDTPEINLTAHVTARTGRVGATVQATDDKIGTDWLPASADPSGSVVLPGIPKDATSVRLVAFAPGEFDADLKVSLAGANGEIVPAGHESLHVKSGMTASVDLGDVTKGEPGSLVLTPTGRATPVVAALRVTRGKGADQEMAFIPATGPVKHRATAADNRAKGSTLSLAAPGKEDAKVRVTASPGSGGGSAVTKTYTVKGGTTRLVPAPVPNGLKGTYALTVERISGTVHAARMLELRQDGVPMFTVQTLPDDRGTVAVPAADQDLSVLQ